MEIGKMEPKIEDGTKEKEISVDEKVVQIVMGENSPVTLDDFQENDKRVLSVLNQDTELAENQYTFNGLARKLGMHQQSLSRSLRRLESSGLVEKGQAGYRVSKTLRAVLVKKSRLDLEGFSGGISRRHLQFTQLLQTYIPSTVGVEEIVARLVGKWFGNLRWLGLVDGDGGHVLQWAAGDKYQVNLKIVSRYAIVESNASGERYSAEAMVSACRILEQMTKVIGSKPRGREGLESFSQYN